MRATEAGTLVNCDKSFRQLSVIDRLTWGLHQTSATGCRSCLLRGSESVYVLVIQVMDFRTGSQSMGGLFGCDVALRFGHKFEAARFFNLTILRQNNQRTRPGTFVRRRFVKAGGKSGHAGALCCLLRRRYQYFRPWEVYASDECP